MEKINNWQYHLTWYTKGRKKILVETIEERVIQMLTDLCDEMKINLMKINVEPDTLSLLLGSKVQVNINKVLRTLQKKLSKSLYKKFSGLKEIGSDLWDGLYLISTNNKDHSEVDIRIEKILDDLWSVEYYDLDEGVTDDLNDFKNYLIGRDLGIIDYGENIFLVDQEELAKEINLNCFECTKIYKYGCCSGSPCNLSPKNKKLFDKHFLNIADEIKQLEETHYKQVMENGGFIDANGSIKECGGRCSLLIEHEGVRKCMTHKYALDHRIPIYDLCPLSCLMYPLEIIELITNRQKKVILLTAVLDEHCAKEFGRWGSYKSLDVDLRCINKKAHNEIFKEEDYRPVYQVNKNLLIHEFSPEFYKGIENLLNT